jgi:hypothetical protein|tara:strand:+ start:1254 stop:1607 length:354 start_codon:yes stop_codon:yes gene_type:complete
VSQSRVPGAELTGTMLDAVVPLTAAVEQLLMATVDEPGLSARGRDTLRRVARTIADLDDIDQVELRRRCPLQPPNPTQKDQVTCRDGHAVASFIHIQIENYGFFGDCNLQVNCKQSN